MSDPVTPIRIFVDADACPVKPEVYRVAERYQLPVFVVANSFMMVPRDPSIQLVVVGSGPDAADDWIAERAGPRDIVITTDVPLADRAIKVGASVIAPSGRPFTQASIGMALATRDLMERIRDAGEITGGPKPFSPRNRSDFLQALNQAVVRLKRTG